MSDRKQLFARRQDEQDVVDVDFVDHQAPSAEAPRAASSAVVMAERAVIGAILRDNTLYDVAIEQVQASDFSEGVTQAVFAYIGDIIDGKVDGIVVADLIAVASSPTICQLAPLETLQAWMAVGSDEPLAVASHARLVANAAAERKLRVAVQEAQGILQGTESVQERAQSIQQKFEDASENRALQVTSLGAAATAALAEMAERAQRGETGVGITTGFEDLDALLAGLHPGQLIIVAARPGVGKTAFAMSMLLETAAAGNHALMASMEMKASELSKRALAIESGVDGHAIRIGALEAQHWEELVTAAEYLSGLPFDVIDMPSVTLAALFAKARRLKREGKLKVLVVDYLQIMETTGGRNSTREQEVAALSRGLKKLAMALAVPVIALSQLNRAVENRVDRRPKMSDLRESGALEQDADVIMFIHREEPTPGAMPAPGLEETAEIIVEKQRSGATGIVKVGVDKKTTRFYSLNATPVYGAAMEQLAA